MIKKYICMLGLGGCLFLSGCSNDVATTEGGDGILPIRFSASISTSAIQGVQNEVQTKADATPFPNNGSIAILAANATQGAIKTNKWAASNLYLNHVAATATGTSATYPISIGSVDPGWPFNPDEYLTFAAYSPATHSTLSKEDTDTDAKLTVQVDGANKVFPDLLYSMPTGRFNKTQGITPVSLNQFQHAMARLVIRVIPVDDKGEEITNYDNAASIKIKKLAITTKVTKGVLNFTAPTPATWLLTAATTDHTLYTIINDASAVALPYNSENKSDSKDDKEYYILPSTADVATTEQSNIALTITDGIMDYTYNNTINEFKKSNTPVTLEMGKITTLTLKVRVMEVSTGDTDAVVLMGDVSPWIDKGNSNVTIE